MINSHMLITTVVAIRIPKSLMDGIVDTQEIMDCSIKHGIYSMVEIIPV